MIVDCHTHINFEAGDIAKSEHLAAAQTVDACIVLATLDRQCEENNKKLSEYVGKYKEKMVGFGVLIPGEDKANVNSLKTIKEKLGLKGVVLYCSACGMHPAHSSAMRFYELSQELGMPVFFHNSSSTKKTEAILNYTQPYLLDEVAREFPDLKIIIANMGVPFVEQTISMISKHQNVYADLTIKPRNVWQTYNTVVAAYEQEVMDKLLFGSGFPSGNAGQCIETLLGLNMLLADTNLPTVPRGSIRNIIERNAFELLGINITDTEEPKKKSKKTKERRSSGAVKEEGKIRNDG
jgi:predicted TIM-barrel fold metal-dependent hydrolase